MKRSEGADESTIFSGGGSANPAFASFSCFLRRLRLRKYITAPMSQAVRMTAPHIEPEMIGVLAGLLRGKGRKIGIWVC